jgi:hypothetical protein
MMPDTIRLPLPGLDGSCCLAGCPLPPDGDELYPFSPEPGPAAWVHPGVCSARLAARLSELRLALLVPL